MVYLKYNNLDLVDAEIIKNTDWDRFWIYMFSSNNLFLFATINSQKLYQILSQSNNRYISNSDSYFTNRFPPNRCLPKNLINFFNEFNNFLSQQKKGTEDIIKELE